ncbi:MAG: outer membrane lipoprotein LolB [Idiomarinaceae bacterium HL-53]|nr:MAG: outer membrane lipoprotein LolB [Idiomarinaceae bacterium HL-53]CUS48786.1 Outer membrane lipoprotein LolB, involved in outer membrane biogenesis [Idiomarinaceae bacterium HL-53]
MLSLLLLGGCAHRPQQTVTGEVVSEATIARHQAQVSSVAHREAIGRIAFFDDVNRDRSAVSFTWSWQQAGAAAQETSTFLKLYHPLRGKLAELSATPVFAKLSMGDEQYEANTVDELLYYYLNVPVPFELISNAVMSRIPSQHISDASYFTSGAPAAFTYTAPFSEESWQVAFNQYQRVAFEVGDVNLPHKIEINGPQYRIHLSINEWNLAHEE